MRNFFNLLMPFLFILLLPYRIWENVHQSYPDQGKIVVQSILFLTAVVVFVYRIKNQKTTAE